MIRQLPKLSLPFFKSSDKSADLDKATDMKIYDLITASNLNNTEGNTMQLQLFQKDSEVNEGVRELHGRLVLNTEQMPDKQDLKFGFVFTNDEQETRYDGLEITAKAKGDEELRSYAWTFSHNDISTTQKPNIFNDDVDIVVDKQNDWVALKDESSVRCDDSGKCEIIVAFIRNFNTMDVENDIAIEQDQENLYALIGYYEAKDSKLGHTTHIGQSFNDLYVLMGAVNAFTSSAALLATASIIALTTF